ncbi:unnamed protein product [Owenia fusiformis]|uniref:Uncharacterized protein n=1 Tax=Owenia fusiformis TaxID=6347 RepID=A0A8J1XKE4_OWEFU|nr:unnamed protein product [Owenia fusiformis]
MIRTVCLLLMALGCYAKMVCVCPDYAGQNVGINEIQCPCEKNSQCRQSADPTKPYGCCPMKNCNGEMDKHCMPLLYSEHFPGTCPQKDVTDIASCKRVCNNDCECNGEGVNLIPPEGTKYKCCKSRVCGRKICRESEGF